MKKNAFSFIKSILLIIIFVMVWYYILLALSVAHNEGVLSVIDDAFGKWCTYTFGVLFIMAILSQFYLRLFIKRESMIQIISYMMTMLFCIGMLAFINTGTVKFKSFSTERWKTYPARRIDMYGDLHENYNVRGWSKSKVIELLGAPDKVVNETYVYSDGYDNSVYVYFNNGVAITLGSVN